MVAHLCLQEDAEPTWEQGPPVLMWPVWSYLLRKNSKGFQIQSEKQLFPMFALSRARRMPSDAGYSLLKLCFAGMEVWDAWEQSQIYFYLLGTNYFRKSSDPRLCNETPRCPHLVWEQCWMSQLHGPGNSAILEGLQNTSHLSLQNSGWRDCCKY